ncbi:PREDICTED: EID1-like F-box protein 2 isoform X2 [Tarenaya hassleriana]|nr:PREDICTED: EID1-like F-box protein 2 isoform X2 [Tarenaya hassleriana]XP_010528387.1 PREDICTED: EID1-like F-box protein 2 isoform X2 [Tarenaya hassleriana]
MKTSKQCRSCIRSASCQCTKFGHLDEDVLFLMFQNLNWNPKLIATMSCVCKWFNEFSKRVLWKEVCRARAPRVARDLQSRGSQTIDVEWRALGKLLVYCTGSSKDGLFKGVETPGHFVHKSRFIKASGKYFLPPKCKTDVLYVSRTCRHLDDGTEEMGTIGWDPGDMGFFRGVFKSFSTSKVRKMLIEKGAPFHPTEVCPYCEAKLWSIGEAEMIPETASISLDAHEHGVEYYVCLNGHMIGACTLWYILESESEYEYD